VEALINKFLAQAMVETKSDELSLSALRVFLSVPASDEGIAQTQIVKTMPDVSEASISRHIAFLAGFEARRKNTIAEPLVLTVPDPLDRRYKYIKLTPAGVALQDRLLDEFVKRLIIK
jgi:DNA-binding MarR family transcriptional regulator